MVNYGTLGRVNFEAGVDSKTYPVSRCGKCGALVLDIDTGMHTESHSWRALARALETVRFAQRP
jgi:hypothetical protein